jgi:hypothetical protein
MGERVTCGIRFWYKGVYYGSVITLRGEGIDIR